MTFPYWIKVHCNNDCRGQHLGCFLNVFDLAEALVKLLKCERYVLIGVSSSYEGLYFTVKLEQWSLPNCQGQVLDWDVFDPTGVVKVTLQEAFE